ncbi:acylneuraminate cytidylyltransferase [Helicobacter pullorum]|uniref:acylneuraminate cytidylyltransferase family protein n=1 Tax=Helicobacter pullorum TaxID=35818 RepID=UPI000816A4D5|nr:acylneuraminate cytidylyltransferase [Helicobacter pullorum]OCR04743.1 acylneuraminate cytidylyltransferase [Helicobacter pullorum]OCR08054.1 acylneuraminate cytidylyltransferase [Helicobacter pullorum]OCR09017.1 acylneuraminate cytidylyltransferase [Helicobacter pullorum]OCR10413.1 acylneuraminate cytidylyltransferase [Helicobacter pullorum]
MRIVAVMPIKLHNKRCPNKNVRLLGQKPLLQYNLEVLKGIDVIDEVYVYCSDKTINNFINNNAIFLERPKTLDEDNTNFTEIFQEFLNEIDADIYVYSHATAPFLKRDSILRCLENVLEKGHDSSFTVTKIQDYLWTSDYRPLNFDPALISRSQDLEVIYRETSGAYVFKKEVFTKYKKRVGINPRAVEVSFVESIDINTEEDFRLASIAVEFFKGDDYGRN